MKLLTIRPLICSVIGILVLVSGCHFANSLTSSIPISMPWRQAPQEEAPAQYLPTFSTYVSPAFSSTRLRRIVLIEAGPDRGNYGASKKMINELAAKFRSNGLFEVITPSQNQFSSMDSILQGNFNERDLAALARFHNADGIGFVRVNELRGFAPMRASITIAIVDSNETVVVYAVDGNWDTAQLPTQNAFRRYVSSQNPGPVGVQLQSPRSFMSFISQQIAESIAAAR